MRFINVLLTYSLTNEALNSLSPPETLCFCLGLRACYSLPISNRVIFLRNFLKSRTIISVYSTQF